MSVTTHRPEAYSAPEKDAAPEDVVLTAGPVAYPAYALTPLQEGFFFNWLRNPHAGYDVQQMVLRLRSLEADAFIHAWMDVAQRHDILRTAFRWRDVHATVQYVVPDLSPLVLREDWRGQVEGAQQQRLATFLSNERERGFDLEAPPLIHISLFQVADDEYEFVWSFPHILLDGRSAVLILREVFERYSAGKEGRAPRLAPVRPFRDFIDWLDRRPRHVETDYWKQKLHGFATPVFPAVAHTSAIPDSGHALCSKRLSVEDTARLNAFVHANGIQVSTMLHAAWALLLGRYASSDDVVFGVTRAGRLSALDGDPSVDRMVGLFINTLPVRVRIPDDRRVIDWLRELRQDQVEVLPHEHTPLPATQSASSVPSGIPLFETLVVFESSDQAAVIASFDRRVVQARVHQRPSFPLIVHGHAEKEMLLRLEYDPARLEPEAAQRMLEHLATIIVDLIDDAEKPLGHVRMLPLAERDRLVCEWNETDAAWPTHATLHGLFEEQARLRPLSAAVTCEGVSLTYAQLDRRANRLAWRLREKGIGPDSLVGVLMERSADTIAVLLGILKAGGAYVPMDTAYPDDRLTFMLEDSDAAIVVTESVFAPRLAGSKAELLLVEDVWADEREPHEDAVPPAAGAGNLCYVIYTSGSTGRPKGVLIEHRNVVRLLFNDRFQFDFNERDVWTVFHSFAFDFSVWEMYGALLRGGRVVVVPRLVAQDPGAFLTLLEEQKVTVLNQVPSAFYTLMQTEMARPGAHLTLRYLVFGGEALQPSLLSDFRARYPATRLINMFGITETTVHVTFKEIGDEEIANGASNIGWPIPTLTTYLLDERLEPVPFGVAGEICVGGAGVARGYLKRPELTAERFIAHPFRTGDRMYRSGDLGRMRPTGEVEYLGRRDGQVKIRGFRIELGEIESLLTAQSEVRSAVALVREDVPGHKRLVAYCVPSDGMPRSVDDGVRRSQLLRDRLKASLPEYMVPTAILWIPERPLTDNGKVNRKALPAPDQVLASAERIGPRDEAETRLLRIWQAVLGVKSIGVTDRFNDVGGHSLAAVKVFTRITSEFGRSIPLATILEHDTVARLAELLRKPVESAEWNCIVRFDSATTGQPIFCIHAAMGNVLIYERFAKRIGTDHPVYGIQAVGNFGSQSPHETVEEMVDFYAAEVFKVQPRGPYVFFGLSFGGTLAIALAHYMRARGHEVKLLAMYDTSGPGYPHFTLYGRFLQFLKGYGNISLRRLFWIVAVDELRQREWRRAYWNIRERAISTAHWWIGELRRHHLERKFSKANPPLDYPLPPNVSRVYLANTRVGLRYDPPFWPGRITYFRAEKTFPGVILDPTRGWAGRSAELEILSLPGEHNDGMWEPGVEIFAQMFRKVLEAADA